MRTFYDRMDKDKKKKLREILDENKKLRKEQLQVIEDGIVKPLKDIINFTDEVKQSRMPIETYLLKNEQLAKQLMGVFGVKK